MRALVISGGGSKGAFAGGVAEHLIRVQKKKYDLFLYLRVVVNFV